MKVLRKKGTSLVVLFGPPGSGKGLHAAELARRLNLKLLTAAAAMRERGSKEEDAESEEFGAVMEERLDKELRAGTGVVLVNYPKTSVQASRLAELARNSGLERCIAVVLTTPVDETIDRISGRRVCQKCGTEYHMRWKTPPTACSKCRGAVIQRDEDREEVVRSRFERYRAELDEMLDEMREFRVVEVNGVGAVPDVKVRIYNAVRGTWEAHR